MGITGSLTAGVILIKYLYDDVRVAAHEKLIKQVTTTLRRK